MKKNKIKYSDRVKIERMLQEGKPKTIIASEIGIARNSLYYEINKCPVKPYNADVAQKNK